MVVELEQNSVPPKSIVRRLNIPHSVRQIILLLPVVYFRKTCPDLSIY